MKMDNSAFKKKVDNSRRSPCHCAVNHLVVLPNLFRYGLKKTSKSHLGNGLTTWKKILL